MKSQQNYGRNIPKIKLDYLDDDFLLEVEGLARDGYDDKQIASILCVSPNTFSRNKVKKVRITEDNPKGESSLSRALKKGRQPLSVELENSLFNRAMGMTVTKTTVKSKHLVFKDGTQTDTQIFETIIEKIELPPDTTAAIFWLKNHKPDIYNRQPNTIDTISNGKQVINRTPLITEIRHVIISEKSIDKLDTDF